MENEPKITKLIGGGSMWYYLLDANGRIIDSSHEDDVSGMSRLRERHAALINGNPLTDRK